ncbi:MAG: hypothetical protein ACOYXY_07810 [Thermodesulfobacteriota bacterium]
MRFEFIIAVWGDSFTDLFLEIGLPSQLMAGNLRHFRGRVDVLYTIYTRSRDRQTIERSAAYEALRNLLPTEISLIDDIDPALHSHTILTECHQRALLRPRPTESALVFLTPDTLWADRSFANLERIALLGKKSVLVPTVRVLKESFVPAILQIKHDYDLPELQLSARELVAATLKHLHPFSACLFWDAQEFSSIPYSIYWRVGTEGVVARCFHMHPLLIIWHRAGDILSNTIDGELVYDAYPDSTAIHVVTDSDEIFAAEISSAAHLNNTSTSMYLSRTTLTAGWALRHANPHHRKYFEHKIRIHSGAISPGWKAIEAESDAAAARIFTAMAVMHVINSLPDRIIEVVPQLKYLRPRHWFRRPFYIICWEKYSRFRRAISPRIPRWAKRLKRSFGAMLNVERDVDSRGR